MDVLPSPIKGGEGNIEYLIRLKRDGEAIGENEFLKAVEHAREKFQKK